MKWVIGLILLALILTSIHGLPARGDSFCDGNACGDLRFSVQGNCHTVTNAGSRRISVSWGPWSKKLAVSEAWTVTNVDGSCVGTIIGKVVANYE